MLPRNNAEDFSEDDLRMMKHALVRQRDTVEALNSLLKYCRSTLYNKILIVFFCHVGKIFSTCSLWRKNYNKEGNVLVNYYLDDPFLRRRVPPSQDISLSDGTVLPLVPVNSTQHYKENIFYFCFPEKVLLPL